jgi:hypothetical protein
MSPLSLTSWPFEAAREGSRRAPTLLVNNGTYPLFPVSTALVTNVDFETWDEYLGDPPLAMAFLDLWSMAPSC